jgi:hypothetical protein
VGVRCGTPCRLNSHLRASAQDLSRRLLEHIVCPARTGRACYSSGLVKRGPCARSKRSGFALAPGTFGQGGIFADQ